MAKVVKGNIYYNTSEVANIVNISGAMIRMLVNGGWFDSEDVYIEPKKEKKYYYLSEKAVEKLKKTYGERK